MKIKDKCYDDEMTLREFAEKYDLELEILERTGWWNPNLGENGRYYCHFKHSDIKEGPCLVGVSGNGSTKQAAVENYAREISDKRLIIDAGSKERCEIRVPRLTGSGVKI